MTYDEEKKVAEIVEGLSGHIESLQRENEALKAIVFKVNDIRNSIIGCQTVNWSEHIYPLVSALEDGGIKGMEYPAAREIMGTLIERTNAAEARAEAAEAEVKRLQAEIDRKSSMPGDHRYWEGRYRDEAAENEKLRVALNPFSRIADMSDIIPDGGTVGVNIDRCRDARQALASTGGEHHAE